MIPAIRCALTPQGDIEAAALEREGRSPLLRYRVVVDPRTGSLLESNVKEGTDMFRWLIRAARRHVTG